jgi:uroporphyrinogen-III synthase
MTDAREDGTVPAHEPGAEMHAIPAPPPAEDEAAAAQMPPDARPSRAPWIAVLAALVVALLVAGSAPLWTPLLPWSPGGDAALEQRVQAAETARRAAEARIARLESQTQQLESGARNAAPASALASLNDRVAALEHRPDTAAQTAQDLTTLRQAIAGLSARLDTIEAKLGKVAAAQSEEGGSDRMLFLAVASLRAAMAGSGPYQGELAAVETLAQGDATLDATLQPLAAAAASGLPSTALLAERFQNETAPAIFRATAAGDVSGDGWGERILARIRALVVVHRVDGGGDPTDTAVARARRALDAGDLAGAVAAVKPLSGAAAKAATPWLAAAEQRLDAQNALDRAAQLVAQRLHGDKN